MKQDRWVEAERILSAGSQLQPQNISLLSSLALLYVLQGRLDEAVEPLQTCCLAEPNKDAHRVLLLAAYEQCSFRTFSASAKQAMLLCLADDDLSHELMSRAWLSLWRLDPSSTNVSRLCAARSYPEFCARVSERALDDWQGDAFFNGGLTRFIVADPTIERGLTFLRRWFFDAWRAGGGQALERRLPLLCIMAVVSFLREFVFPQSEDISELASRVGSPGEAALLACYQPLFARNDAARLASFSRLPWYRELVRTHIDEPLAELALQAEIPSLRPIADPVSRSVGAQYEANPYPRWTNVGRGPAISPATLRAAEGKTILCAGCGTGREAVEAASIFPLASVLAVDLSRASLAHGARKAREAGLPNLEFKQADLLDLGQVGRTFDLIVCAGVLHHLQNPVTGLRALIDVMRPGGAMKIGLYSTYARAFITALRASIPASHFPATAEGIRAFRSVVLARDDDDPLKRQLIEWPDFYSTSACRDLLFHVQERTFTLLQIDMIARELGLSVLHVNTAHPSHHAAYRRRFPQDRQAVNLANWHALERERPTMFARMYSLWFCRAADRDTIDVSWIRDTNRM